MTRLLSARNRFEKRLADSVAEAGDRYSSNGRDFMFSGPSPGRSGRTLARQAAARPASRSHAGRGPDEVVDFSSVLDRSSHEDRAAERVVGTRIGVAVSEAGEARGADDVRIEERRLVVEDVVHA